MRDNYLNQTPVVPTVLIRNFPIVNQRRSLSCPYDRKKITQEEKKWARIRYEWSQSCLFVSLLLVITMETNLNLKTVWSIFWHTLLTKFLLYRFKLFWKQNWGRCGPMFDRFSAVDKIKKVRCYIPFTHIIIRPWKGV